jgi:hypothetical protein
MGMRVIFCHCRMFILLSLYFFQIPFFPLRLYLSFSLLKASVWFCYTARLLSSLSRPSHSPCHSLLLGCCWNAFHSSQVLFSYSSPDQELHTRGLETFNSTPTTQSSTEPTPRSPVTVSHLFPMLLTACTNCNLAGQRGSSLFQQCLTWNFQPPSLPNWRPDLFNYEQQQAQPRSPWLTHMVHGKGESRVLFKGSLHRVQV